MSLFCKFCLIQIGEPNSIFFKLEKFSIDNDGEVSYTPEPFDIYICEDCVNAITLD